METLKFSGNLKYSRVSINNYEISEKTQATQISSKKKTEILSNSKETREVNSKKYF